VVEEVLDTTLDGPQAGPPHITVTYKRLKALRGQWLGLADRDIRPPTKKLSVFWSSTFTDTYRERDYIMNELLPKLRRQAATTGIQIVFVDMR
jgi:hypothetical protein